jgi:hypothetical protein
MRLRVQQEGIGGGDASQTAINVLAPPFGVGLPD